MNEDTLVLFYYKDGLSDRERRKVEAAINNDTTVARQYEALCQQLNGLDERAVPAVPTHTVQRWHDSIDRAAQQERRQAQRSVASSRPFSFAWGGAVAAALVIGISIGIYFSGDDVTQPTPGIELANNSSGNVTAVPAAFTRGVTMYLRDTHQEITSLASATSTDQALLILRIIEQNRLFERAAEQNNSQSLARVLRAFEPILLRLAADDIAPEDAEALRAQLAFELNVMLTKLSRKPSKETQTT
jgi:hypothetical protein